MMDPQISVIVPVYNVEPYLHKCINSIINQTHKDFELILIDDGSPDSCGLICEDYAKRDRRIKVIHKENGGLSSARNSGIEVAKGKYIAFIDGDDYVHPNMLEVMYNTAEQHSSDMVVCDFVKVNENDDYEINSSKSIKKIQHFTNIRALMQLFSNDHDDYITGAGNNVKWVVVWNKLYKRELFIYDRFYEGHICEDEFIIHKLLYSCRKVTYISCEFYFYVQRTDSIINSSYSIKRFDKVKALQDRADFFNQIDQQYLHEKAIKSYVDVFFWNYYKAKNELINVNSQLLKLRKEFNHHLIYILKCNQIGWKQKIAIMVFFVSPYLFELFIPKELTSSSEHVV